MHLLFVNYLVIMHFLVWSCTFFKLWTVGRYFALNFRVPTVFDIIPIKLVRFRNTESLFSISFPAIWFSLSCSYSNINVENNRGVFRPFSTEFILMCVWICDLSMGHYRTSLLLPGCVVPAHALEVWPRHGLLLRAVLGPGQNTRPYAELTGPDCMPKYKHGG